MGRQCDTMGILDQDYMVRIKGSRTVVRGPIMDSAALLLLVLSAVCGAPQSIDAAGANTALD